MLEIHMGLWEPVYWMYHYMNRLQFRELYSWRGFLLPTLAFLLMFLLKSWLQRDDGVCVCVFCGIPQEKKSNLFMYMILDLAILESSKGRYMNVDFSSFLFPEVKTLLKKKKKKRKKKRWEFPLWLSRNKSD